MTDKEQFLSLYNEKKSLEHGLYLRNRAHECYHQCPCNEPNIEQRLEEITVKMERFHVIETSDILGDGRFAKIVKLLKPHSHLLLPCFLVRLVTGCNLSDATYYVNNVEAVDINEGTDIL